MPSEPQALGVEPDRAQIDASRGALLLEFGATWCGFCQALAPPLARLLESFPEVRHLKVEDGSGKRLGRSFGVTIWPTLVFLRDGRILAQLVRPPLEGVREALKALVRETSDSAPLADGS